MTVFTGNANRNILTGTLGNDELYGFDGNDDLFGSNGHDHLKGGGGADLLDGGDGFDTADYRDSNAAVAIDLQWGRGWNGSAQDDTLVSIEDVIGSAYRDALFGSTASNVLLGENDNDVLYGYGNDDALYGGNGDDLLFGGEGFDFIVGGDGNDTAAYGWSATGVSVSLMPDPITGMGFGSAGEAYGDTLYQVENLAGSYHADQLWGDDGNNVLWSFEGNDQLYGNGGHDELNGGFGIDVLEGGSGADRFLWQRPDETGSTAKTADIIVDFNIAQGDVIDLDQIDADVYAFGNQSFIFIGMASFTLNAATPDPTDLVPGEIRYYHLDGNTYIEMQTGTSSDIEGVIRLNGIHNPDASWFAL